MDKEKKEKEKVILQLEGYKRTIRSFITRGLYEDITKKAMDYILDIEKKIRSKSDIYLDDMDELMRYLREVKVICKKCEQKWRDTYDHEKQIYENADRIIDNIYGETELENIMLATGNLYTLELNTEELQNEEGTLLLGEIEENMAIFNSKQGKLKDRHLQRVLEKNIEKRQIARGNMETILENPVETVLFPTEAHWRDGPVCYECLGCKKGCGWHMKRLPNNQLAGLIETGLFTPEEASTVVSLPVHNCNNCKHFDARWNYGENDRIKWKEIRMETVCYCKIHDMIINDPHRAIICREYMEIDRSKKRYENMEKKIIAMAKISGR